MAAHLEIRLFGPPSVQIGGEPLPRLKTRKGLWLLALLALRHGRDVDRVWLAGTLWPDADEAISLTYLRQTLTDLQYIVNRILFQQDQSTPKVMLDVGGYRSQAREALVQKARDAAEKVRRWGDAVELEPLNAFDRRIVHQALRDDPDIETHSVEVDGTDKKVLLLRPRRR